MYVEAPTIEEWRHQFGDTTSLHRVVMNAWSDQFVDHINGNPLDCRRSTLRLCTQSQNASNRRYKNRTGFRGVRQSGRKFFAQIEVRGPNGKRGVRNLGTFDTAIEAAQEYNRQALIHFGEFAVLNEV